MKATIDKKRHGGLSSVLVSLIILPFKSKILCSLQVCGPNCGKNRV